MASRVPRLFVLAGVNGAGKSSIGGAMFRASGADYFNPDEAARALMTANPGLAQTKANSLAWHKGKALLEQAIDQRLDFAMETTLGASSIPRLLGDAARQGFEINVWYVGLATVEQHIARVQSRVNQGGHAIPEADIRRRFTHSRLNLIQLLSSLAALRVYDNSTEGDPALGVAPSPTLILHLHRGRIVGPRDLAATPPWAKPIVAAAMKLALA